MFTCKKIGENSINNNAKKLGKIIMQKNWENNSNNNAKNWRK